MRLLFFDGIFLREREQRTRHRLEDNIERVPKYGVKMPIGSTGLKTRSWEHGNYPSDSIEGNQFLDYMRTSLYGVS
jgi:hypothetical protein